MKISIIYYTYKMNIKRNLLEEYVNLLITRRNEIKNYGCVQLYLYL